MNRPETPDEWVWLARIRHPQGRRGEVFAEILTDFPDKFAQRRQLWLLSGFGPRASSHHMEASSGRLASGSGPSSRAVQLTHHWLHKGGIVLHFAGVESISDAETLAGLIVAIPRSERVPLPADEIYIGDLIGCELVDVTRPETPLTVGQIENVEREAGPVPLLMARGAAGEILVPFAKDYLRKIDLDAKRVEVALPEGLIGLNTPEHS